MRFRKQICLNVFFDLVLGGFGLVDMYTYVHGLTTVVENKSSGTFFHVVTSSFVVPVNFLTSKKGII